MRLQTLDRGLALLEWVAANPGNATVRQAAEALGVNMTTCYHLVDTLIARGYLVRTGYGHLGVGSGADGSQLRLRRSGSADGTTVSGSG